MSRTTYEDPRLRCEQGDRGGRYGLYRVIGRTDVVVEFDSDADPEYPWTPVPIVNGRMVSGVFNGYQTSTDAVNAIEDGSWRDIGE